MYSVIDGGACYSFIAIFLGEKLVLKGEPEVHWPTRTKWKEGASLICPAFIKAETTRGSELVFLSVLYSKQFKRRDRRRPLQEFSRSRLQVFNTTTESGPERNLVGVTEMSKFSLFEKHRA